jgi:hypothetical protein
MIHCFAVLGPSYPGTLRHIPEDRFSIIRRGSLRTRRVLKSVVTLVKASGTDNAVHVYTVAALLVAGQVDLLLLLLVSLDGCKHQFHTLS